MFSYLTLKLTQIRMTDRVEFITERYHQRRLFFLLITLFTTNST